ncbi:myotubularin-related protein 6-like isoform X2 [Watersipora subatra]
MLTFVIPRERTCVEVLTALTRLSQPERVEDLYAFKYKSPELMGNKSVGWSFFDIESEFLRMGVPNALWIRSSANSNYELCDTYPKHIYVPAGAKPFQIIGSSKFRSRCRLPVLSYLHRDNQAALTRCSQPLVGLNARCIEDEQLLQCISEANPGSKHLFVVDTRPMINAVANRAAGKGYENEKQYSNIKFKFLGIANIHIMRASLQKLLEVSDMKSPTMHSYLKAVDESNWLKHIKTVLETSVFIANKIVEGTSVLVHCSDGWDRTAQTCSLASLMLDPHYRTLQGFQALIEKEWLSFGHKFTDRCRHLFVVESKEESPVFTQFLDATWQMMSQFPAAFQFNERFLLTLHDHLYSCQFGTFLGNCEKDRLDLRLSEKTYSLWGYIANNITDFINPLYRKEYEMEKSILIPKVYPQNISYWKGMYNRFDANVHERENIPDILSALVDHNASLEDHINLLEKRVQELARLLGRPVADITQKLQGLLSAESLYCLNTLLETDGADPLTFGAVESCLPSYTKASLSDGLGDAPPANGGGDSKLDQDDLVDDKESGFEDGSNLSKSNVMTDSIIIADGLDNVTLEEISHEANSVAINLETLRNQQQCSCSAPFHHFSKRYHCCKCGSVFCSKCIQRHTPLAGHYSQKPVPVCKDCYKAIKSRKSMLNLQRYSEQHTSAGEITPVSSN